MKNKVFIFIFFILVSFCSYAQHSLLIKSSDIQLIPEKGENFEDISGYHLYIRKTRHINSVMLTETTKDPLGKNDNYSYRAAEFNDINGNEIRYLNGEMLTSEYSKFSLIDSTPEKHEKFGQAFHIYIPKIIQFGYPWSRNGTIEIGKGTFVNIRAFEKKYADYTGAFYDNPYMFDLGKIQTLKKNINPKDIHEEEIPILTDSYNPLASEAFKELSSTKITYSKGPETIVQDIMQTIKSISPKTVVDIVFAIDATGSMKDDIEQLRNEWIPELVKVIKEFEYIRLGLLLYRDYGDNFNYQSLPVKFYDFTDNPEVFIKNLNGFTIRGNEGGDIPEAVYEALYASIQFYKWNETAAKKIILIGDAEPHSKPRGTGKYSKDLVTKLAKEKNISIQAIITPDDKSKRGR